MMKKIILTVAIIGSAISGRAADLFDQLVAFNYNWTNYESRIGNANAPKINSETEYIQMHLTNVLEILKTNPTDQLNKLQLTSRTNLIGVLTEYRNEGLFPINYYKQERIPVFIDEHNTHCAVGYLLAETGHDDLAQSISKMDNYVWVKDLKLPEVLEWQKSSGFTLEELKLIQGAYDFYQPMAFTLPNRTEIPQKPEVVVRNFDGEKASSSKVSDLLSVWCYGEGKNGVLHGKWIQNYRENIPWIEGYYENGKRTGSWKEYYMGTSILCRTEHWRNDKLNGVRTRYDREGNVVERITFKDGEATKKINYDLRGGLEWIRIPIDSMTVRTEMYTSSGYLLAKGVENIYNPSGLLWFQNIELTALNTAAITARDGAPEYVTSSSQNIMQPSFLGPRSFQQPSLVQYLKIGEWTYYNEYTADAYSTTANTTIEYLNRDFPHVGGEIFAGLKNIEFVAFASTFDSLTVSYDRNQITEVHAFNSEVQPRIAVVLSDQLLYGNVNLQSIYSSGLNYDRSSYRTISAIGPVDENGYRIGNWYHYDRYGRAIKVESYLQPWKPEEELSLKLPQN